ncbi:MAG TPA: hypothetical protein EYP29_00060 [Thermoplasmata archaeon]|nr:hypothetical protein [Thermoplasmata archaeon]
MVKSVWTVMKDLEPMEARRYFLDHLPRKPCMVRPPYIYCVLCMRINSAVAYTCPVWAEKVDEEEEEEIMEEFEKMEMIETVLERPRISRSPHKGLEYAEIDVVPIPTKKKTIEVEVEEEAVEPTEEYEKYQETAVEEEYQEPSEETMPEVEEVEAEVQPEVIWSMIKSLELTKRIEGC